MLLAQTGYWPSGCRRHIMHALEQQWLSATEQAMKSWQVKQRLHVTNAVGPLIGIESSLKSVHALCEQCSHAMGGWWSIIHMIKKSAKTHAKLCKIGLGGPCLGTLHILMIFGGFGMIWLIFDIFDKTTSKYSTSLVLAFFYLYF